MLLSALWRENKNLMNLRIVLFTIFVLYVSSVFGQTKSDSIELKTFWSEAVVPFIEKDTNKIKTIVEFPLGGEWGWMMGLDTAPKDWTQSDFINNFDKLFDEKVIGQLKKQTYKDVDILSNNILVSVNWKDDGGETESGIILRYKYIDGKWKLYMIQGAG